jgi:hypothetical protein
MALLAHTATPADTFGPIDTALSALLAITLVAGLCLTIALAGTGLRAAATHRRAQHTISQAAVYGLRTMLAAPARLHRSRLAVVAANTRPDTAPAADSPAAHSNVIALPLPAHTAHATRPAS